MKHTTSSQWKRIAVGAMAVILVAGVVTGADARRGDHRGARGDRAQRFGEVLRGLAGLDLTQEQRDTIRAILRNERSEIRPVMERVREARQELQDAIANDPIDKGLIRQKAQVMADIGVDLALLRAQIGAKVRGVLTQEQRERADELRERRQQRARARAAAAWTYLDVMSEE